MSKNCLSWIWFLKTQNPCLGLSLYIKTDSHHIYCGIWSSWDPALFLCLAPESDSPTPRNCRRVKGKTAQVISGIVYSDRTSESMFGSLLQVTSETQSVFKQFLDQFYLVMVSIFNHQWWLQWKRLLAQLISLGYLQWFWSNRSPFVHTGIV